jgi:hypothetical protein
LKLRFSAETDGLYPTCGKLFGVDLVDGRQRIGGDPERAP